MPEKEYKYYYSLWEGGIFENCFLTKNPPEQIAAECKGTVMEYPLDVLKMRGSQKRVLINPWGILDFSIPQNSIIHIIMPFEIAFPDGRIWSSELENFYDDIDTVLKIWKHIKQIEEKSNA